MPAHTALHCLVLHALFVNTVDCLVIPTFPGTELPIEAKKTMLHEFVAKKLNKLGGFAKFANKHNVKLSNESQTLLEKDRKTAALEVDKDNAASKAELASLKLGYKAMKQHKRELVQKAKILTDEIELAETKQNIHNAAEKMLLMKERMVQLGYNGHASLKRQQEFSKLYLIKYGATGYRYHNNPNHPGVRTENDGGAYSKYGWVLNPTFKGAQTCEEYSQCPDVFMSGNHADGSQTCQDDPTYHDCDGDSCEYYEENPDECGQNDQGCGSENTGEFTFNLANPCKSQGTKMQGCCVCQHHKSQFDGCGTPAVGDFSEGWTCNEAKSDYMDAGCGTWETCEERIAKEDWTDREGHTCQYYEDHPEMCDDALSRQYMGHDSKSCSFLHALALFCMLYDSKSCSFLHAVQVTRSCI